MEELVKRVSERAGITEDQARSAVDTVAGFLKEKVPAPYSSYIDNFMGSSSSGGGSGASGGSLRDLAGGLFGKK